MKVSAAHMNGGRFCPRYAWPSGDWGSLPIAGARKRPTAPSWKARLAEVDHPWSIARTSAAESFLVEEIVAPQHAPHPLRLRQPRRSPARSEAAAIWAQALKDAILS